MVRSTHTDQKRLRAALIGSGKMGLHHLRAIAASGIADVVAIADPFADAEALGPLAPNAVVVRSADEMFERVRPDVVHIVTPPATHGSLALQAIAAGCHVYIEKPFTATREEAQRILDAAAERGVTVCAGHQVLFEAPALAVWDSLADIGRLVHVESYFSFRMVRRTITPTDQVKDILPHAVYPVVDQLRRGTGVLDEPIRLVGVSADADGETYALLRLGKATAIVLVTLNGRPIEQYQQLVGTNGSLRPDYIGGSMTRLIGPGTGPGVLLTPYRRAFRMMTGTTRGIAKLISGGGNSYPGLGRLVAAFHDSIASGQPSPLSPQSILDTVDICEQVAVELDAAERAQESAACARLRAAEAALPALVSGRPGVLLTGGTGLLGRRTAEELRRCGFAVRVVARRSPPFSRRVPGIEYVAADLSRDLDPALMDGIGLVVHGAAETAGGRADHVRNSVNATRNLIETAARAGVRHVLHVSSLAILKTSREVGRPLDEEAPVDASEARGPYVWGKAESEILAQQLGRDLGIAVKVVRPGPLVDYGAFHPPGRLGRELGPWFVAIGPKRGALSVCDISTAARVIRLYAEEFDNAPPLLNLVESPPPTRRELLGRFLEDRPDLSVFWFPALLLRMLSGPLKLAQRVALGSKQPIDIAAAFASERYRTDLAATTIARAVAPANPRPVAQ